MTVGTEGPVHKWPFFPYHIRHSDRAVTDRHRHAVTGPVTRSPDGRILVRVTEHSGSTGATPDGRLRPVAVAALVWLVGAVLAFTFLDPIIAAFLAIMGLTLVVVAFFARDWDQHSTFEEREMVRARKRKAKWEKGKDKRARDRARWEAHQRRRAEREAGR
jgi:hypothetical protein